MTKHKIIYIEQKVVIEKKYIWINCTWLFLNMRYFIMSKIIILWDECKGKNFAIIKVTQVSREVKFILHPDESDFYRGQRWTWFFEGAIFSIPRKMPMMCLLLYRKHVNNG